MLVFFYHPSSILFIFLIICMCRIIVFAWGRLYVLMLVFFYHPSSIYLCFSSYACAESLYLPGDVYYLIYYGMHFLQNDKED